MTKIEASTTRTSKPQTPKIMKTDTKTADAIALADSFDLKTRILKDGRTQLVHPITGNWVDFSTRSDVQRITDETVECPVRVSKAPNSSYWQATDAAGKVWIESESRGVVNKFVSDKLHLIPSRTTEGEWENSI
jgi:hypothetical protein